MKSLLEPAIFLEAHPMNYNHKPREFSTIKYIVIHYTGNINDTAKNNAVYFHNNFVGASAHYFVDESTVYQSVLLNYPAYSVGLGKRKEPYFKWPIMWKKITNANSISIEICGGKTDREASDKTKDRAAQLTAELLHEFDLTPSCVYRHYDVTGKECPAWAVYDEANWIAFKASVCRHFYKEGDEDDMLKNNPENYEVFKEFMERYEREKAEKTESDPWEITAMKYARDRGLITGERPHSSVKRVELAEVLRRLNA